MTIFVVLFLTDSCLKSPTMNKYAMLLMGDAPRARSKGGCVYWVSVLLNAQRLAVISA